MKRDPASWVFGMLAVASLAIAAFNRPQEARPLVAKGTQASTRHGTSEHGGQPKDAGAGHDATTPAEMPARGWWAIAKRVAANVSGHRLLTEAAGITFYALLAFFPALAAMVSLYGLFADPTTISDSIADVSGMVPGGGMEIITDQLHALTANGRGKLGFSLALGLLTSLWSANQGTKALFDAMNVVYDETEKRSFLLRTTMTLGFTLGGILFVLLAMAAVVAVPVVLETIGLGGVAEFLLQFLRWPVLLLALAGLLACIYRFGPSRESARWHWVTWGGGIAALAWVVGSAGFSYYVSHFGSFNKTYGSLGAVVGFMTWIWLSATIVLIGAEVNAELEHQTAQDTTTGPEQSPGARGATKADAVVSA